MKIRAAVLVLALSALAAGGCGTANGGPGVASVAGSGATPSATTDVITAYVEQVRTFVGCMRAEGVDVSDPDPKGKIQFEGDNANRKRDPKFLAASKKCANLMPPLPAELVEWPVLSPEEIDAARRYAKCMQTSGAPDFPDPRPDGNFPYDSTWKQDTEAALRAGRICGPIVGQPATPGPAQG